MQFEDLAKDLQHTISRIELHVNNLTHEEVTQEKRVPLMWRKNPPKVLKGNQTIVVETVVLKLLDKTSEEPEYIFSDLE